MKTVEHMKFSRESNHIIISPSGQDYNSLMFYSALLDTEERDLKLSVPWITWGMLVQSNKENLRHSAAAVWHGYL